MKNQNLMVRGLMHALGTFLYVALVVTVMSNGENLFDGKPEILIGMFMLTLFVTSATITSLLVFGKPVVLYLGGEKSNAVTLLFSTVGFLLGILLIVGAVVVFF